MTAKQKRLVEFILWIAILAIGIKMGYSYFNTQTIEPYGLFALSIFVASLFELHTFGKITYLGRTNKREEKDELEEHIEKVSSKISYYLLMVIVLIIMIVSEWVDDKDNGIDIPIMLVFCATIVTLPFVQFFVARKNKYK